MARKWKIIIGVAVALAVVACVAVPIVGVVLFRGRMRVSGWESEEMHRWEPGEAQHHEVEVELVDDDGDGVPDRGVIELPEEVPFGRGRFGRFGPGHGMRFDGRAFGPFFFVGGLLRLALLAVVVTLGIVFYRKWRKAHPKAS
jgi:hypothetical protein